MTLNMSQICNLWNVNANGFVRSALEHSFQKCLGGGVLANSLDRATKANGAFLAPYNIKFGCDKHADIQIGSSLGEGFHLGMVDYDIRDTLQFDGSF